MVRHVFALVGMCVALLLSAPASATDIYYAVFQSGSPDPLYYWRLDQTATTPASYVDGTSFTVNDVAGYSLYSPAQYDVTYYSTADGGGFQLSDALTSAVLLDATGSTLYTGPESSPTLLPASDTLDQPGTNKTFTLAATIDDVLNLYPSDSGPPPPPITPHVYDFSITGDYTADWQLITPSAFLAQASDGHSWSTVGYTAGDFAFSPGAPALIPDAILRFYDDSQDGGLTITDPDPGVDYDFFDATGEQLFDPTDPSALFKTGSYVLTGIAPFAGKTATLTITEVLPVPEAPTWLMAIAGFTLLGGVLRRRVAMPAIAFR